MGAATIPTAFCRKARLPIIRQSSRLGELRLVGVSSDDTLRVFVDQYRTDSIVDGGRFTVDTDAQALLDVDTVENSFEYKLRTSF